MTDPLTDVLDDATYSGDVAATSSTVSFTSPNIVWTGKLTPGQSATVTYSVTVKNPDTGNGVLSNTVTSTSAGGNCPSGSTDPTCGDTVTVSGRTISKTANVSAAAPGSTVNYTITATNSGKALMP
jgi:large repetitive protein